MKALELNILNRLAPYEVVLRDGEYYFHTDFNIEDSNTYHRGVLPRQPRHHALYV